MSRRGDVARRLHLTSALRRHGGWRSRHHHGLVSSLFVDLHFGSWYAGPSCYPSHCWTPHWSPWVAWSWWDHCISVYDPRPVFCRPYLYRSCRTWRPWSYPVWVSLPVVSSGTWVDAPVPSIDEGLDLQLLAVRFVDPGHPERKLGPRYRVWFRNNSKKKIREDFDVVLLASNSRDPKAGHAQAGVEVDKIDAGQMQSVDIRLPYSSITMSKDTENRGVPFEYLHVIVDADRDVKEAFEANNGVVLARGDVLPVDPVAFSTNVTSSEPGAVISLAGEGLGPEPGEVIVYVNKIELQAEIQGWYDLGIQIRLPRLPLAAETQAEIVVVRGDGAVTNPIALKLVPAKNLVLPPPAPVK